MKPEDYLLFKVDKNWSDCDEICFFINGDDFYRIKITKKGTKLYNSSSCIVAVLKEGKKYTREEFDAMVDANRESMVENQVKSIIKKDPLIGALFAEVIKKYSNAYIKYGNKDLPNLVAVPFAFTTIYVGVDNGKYIVKFNSPEVGGDHVIGDITNPDIDLITNTMKILYHFKKAADLVGV